MGSAIVCRADIFLGSRGAVDRDLLTSRASARRPIHTRREIHTARTPPTARLRHFRKNPHAKKKTHTKLCRTERKPTASPVWTNENDLAALRRWGQPVSSLYTIDEPRENQQHPKSGPTKTIVARKCRFYDSLAHNSTPSYTV